MPGPDLPVHRLSDDRDMIAPLPWIHPPCDALESSDGQEGHCVSGVCHKCSSWSSPKRFAMYCLRSPMRRSGG